MRSILTSVIISALLAVAPTASQAQGLFDPQSAHDWSGFYLGGHVGAGAASKEWTLIQNANYPNGNPNIGNVMTDYVISGFLGGVQGGFNRQDGNWVYGLEGEFSLTAIEGVGTWTASGNNPGPRDGATSINWLATIGPRVGWAAGPTLFFLEGGIAIANEDYSHLGNAGVYTGNSTRAGVFVGGGAEFAIDDTWSVEFEYNFLHLGTDRVSLTRDGAPGPAIFDIAQQMHTVKVGVNNHFN